MDALDPRSTAVLMMDAQEPVLAGLGEKAPAPIEAAARLLAAARAAQVAIFHVVVGFRPGYPELRPGTPFHARLAGSGGRFTGAPGADIVPALRPLEGELVVTKKRISAFAGSDLEMLLRARGIATLVLAGFATSGVVLSTQRQAFDLDFAVVVAADACGDADDEVHRLLTEKVFARYARVAPVAEVAAAFARA
jgi:nicotinamidase-related amidase